MKHLFFKSFLAFIVFSSSLLAQKQLVYQKSYEANKNSTLYLELKNITAGIEPSTDGKIHFDYYLEFENYSKKEMKEIVERINIESARIKNDVKLNASSITKVPKVGYSFKTDVELVYKPGLLVKEKKKVNKNKEYRKSKDSILSEIQSKGMSELNRILKKFKTKYQDGKGRKINVKNVKVKKTFFVIKIPPFVKLNIKGNSSQVTFIENFSNEIIAQFDGGFLRAKALTHNLNQISVKNGIFEAEKISGKNYTFNNVPKCLIGEATNVFLNSEVSKIEFGEIHNNVSISDFNSEFYLYNFSDFFEKFSLKSEYSKIHFFEPEYGFDLKIFGNNTVFHMGEVETKIRPKKNNKISLMLEVKKSEDKKYSGLIRLETLHGIIFLNFNKDKKSSQN